VLEALVAEFEVVGVGILLGGEVQPVATNDQDDFGQVLHFCRPHLEQAVLSGVANAAFRPGVEEVVDEPGGLQGRFIGIEHGSEVVAEDVAEVPDHIIGGEDARNDGLCVGGVRVQIGAVEHLLQELDVGIQDVLLGPEVVPEGSLEHAGPLGNGRRGHRSESALVEEDEAGLEQPVARLGREPVKGGGRQQSGGGVSHGRGGSSSPPERAGSSPGTTGGEPS
jgi:hypothetical protein